MKTAEYIKALDGWKGDARLYKLSEPMEYEKPWDNDGSPAQQKQTEHVIVSAVYAFSGPETSIFPADKDGDALNMAKLDGSYRGGLSHSEALRRAGYSV
jgi:hypothetical protein